MPLVFEIRQIFLMLCFLLLSERTISVFENIGMYMKYLYLGPQLLTSLKANFRKNIIHTWKVLDLSGQVPLYNNLL